MRKAISILLFFSILISSALQQSALASQQNNTESLTSKKSVENLPVVQKEDLDFSSLNDPDLIRYMQESVYEQLIADLDSDEYYIDDIQVGFISQEYLDELAYNSKANIFFGYTLEELDEQFSGIRYVFDLGEDGTTVVHEVQSYDDTFDSVIKNVAIGTGVIIICVTISVVTGGLGAPAVSMIFACAAKTGAVAALSSGVISGASAGIITGLKTHDMETAFKDAALAGSEGFKWGAIGGAVAGGVGEGIALHGATLNGLTMNQAAAIQKESGYPLELIRQFKSFEEYQVYKDAGLFTRMVDGKLTLVRDIDLDFVSEFPNGEVGTNLMRMQKGYAPLDPATGNAYQLHHINQDMNGTLAILTESEHQGNSAILNLFGKESEIDRRAFDSIRREFWKSFAECLA